MKANHLSKIHADIDARVTSIRKDNPDWLCRMGCDGCCRRLAEIPQLTVAEWQLLQIGLTALSLDKRQEIIGNVAILTKEKSGFVSCPLLDKSAGVCVVYAHRPVACRTYGFYVQHNYGLYCNDIEALVDKEILENVIWGNQDAIERRLNYFNDARTLTDWFAEWNDNVD